MNSFKLYVVHLFTWIIPPTRCFGLKRNLYRWCGAKVGRNVRIVSSARFCFTGRLTIGDNTWIGHEVLVIGGDANVHIGANCDIGPRVSFVTGSHQFGGEGGRAAGNGYSEEICLEDGVWIGAAATILGGVSVGNASMVAAGALVRKNVASNTVVAGVPAKEIRKAITGV
jgi:acetyltransferase-like isoleucine patch superfamily enzyme